MKTSSDFIWQFIHSLTNAEKTYFRRNFATTTQKESALYLQLFDAIALQKIYDEKKIIQTFSPGITARNIAFQKHYLLTQLNNALVDYYSRNNIYQEIYKQIQLIRVYRKKGLLDEAHHIWKKTMNRARKAESFAMSSLLKSEFEKMILFSSSHISYDELHTIFNQNALTYPEYTDMVTLRDIYAEIVLIKRKVHYDIDDTQTKTIQQLLKQINKYDKAPGAKSFWFRHYFTMSKATLLYLLHKMEEAFNLFAQNLLEWKKHPDFITSNGEHYLELLYMINYAGISCGKYSYVTAAFNDNCNKLIEDKMQRANFEAIQFLAFNKVYNKTAKYDAVGKLIQYMNTHYKQWEPLLNNDINRTVNLSLGIASFVLEKYNDSFSYIKNAIINYKDGAREEHIAVGQLLLLLITYSMNNARLFDAQYRSTYTYFYKRKKKQPFETALVQCLHRSFYMTSSSEKLKEYQKALIVFEENKANVIQQMASSIFNYPGWLQSKTQRISYKNYVELKVKNQDMVSVS
jgi:hypothetical protein